MWGLIVLLVCVAAVHVESEECSCSRVRASFYDFVIYAEVSSEANNGEDHGNAMYTISTRDIFKKIKGKQINDKIYVSTMGPCPVQLTKGKEYILIGKFGEGDRQQITGCGTFEISSRASNRKSS